MLFPIKLKKQSLSLLAGLFFSFTAWAQIPKAPINIQSPTAASFGSYGEIPVSPFTGKPDISINLHTVSDGNIQIPIGLNYDGSGVRPDVHPGWVGLNFNLSTTYAVTRTIKDWPDDGMFVGTLGSAGYLFTSSILNTTDWTTEAKMKSNTNVSLTNDLEPDEYSFSMPGLSGKFYYGHDQKWKIQCDRPVTVDIIGTTATVRPPFTPPSFVTGGNNWQNLGNGYLPHMEGFIIKDEFGTEYTFGGGDAAYSEYSIDFFSQGKSTWFCNNWHLKTIKRQTGQVITFKYERGALVAQMNFSVVNKAYSVNGSGFLNADCFGSSSIVPLSGAYNGKLISPIYLTEISGDNFKVKYTSNKSTELRYEDDIFATFVNNYTSGLNNGFMLDILTYLYDCFYPVNSNSCAGNATPLTTLLTRLQWRKLDKIEVQNGSGVTIKEFDFSYNNVLTERLMLQKVQEKSGYNNNTIPPYEFEYYTDAVLTLPGYGKSHTDHWGYNNGKMINTSTDFSSVSTYGATFRSVPTDKKQYLLGSLKQIKYPTGGITKYWFEPHTYAHEVKLNRWDGLDPFASNQIAGGLRIKEIHSYDPNVSSPTVIKKYYYLTGFNPASPDTTSLLSSGVLGGKAKYWWPDYQPKPEGNYTYTQQVFSTQSVLPVTENSMGSHIGYSQVIETSSPGGWTVHSFTNFDNGYLDGAPSGFLQSSTTAYEPYNSNAFKRGKPVSIASFFQNGNPASKIEYQYTLLGSINDNSARSFKSLKTELCNPSGNYVNEGTAFLINVQKFLPQTETTYTYDQNDPSKYSWQANTTGYKPNGQVQQLFKTDSKTLADKVPLDGSPTNVYNRQILTSFTYPDDYTTGVFPDMKLRNIIGSPVEITTRLAVVNSGGFNYSPIKWQKTSYKAVDLAVGYTYLPEKVESKIGSETNATTDIEFKTYDDRGNLLTFSEKGGATTKLEYYGTSDTGKTDLQKSRTEADGSTVSATTYYDYKPMVGIEKITAPSGKVIWYNYDDFNRLSNIREDNALGNLLKSFDYNYGLKDNGNKYNRILIIGNSITKLVAQSGTDGWQSPALSAAGGWGRASSTKDKDFAHILESRFQKLNPSAQVLPLWEALFERDYASGIAGWVSYNYGDLQNRIINGFGGVGNKPDLIIIRLGENVNNTDVNPQNFKLAFNTLIDKILAVSTPGAKVIVTNSMWPDQPLADAKIQEVATERGLPFVNLSDMISNPVFLAGNDPATLAAFPNNTCDRHPGDAGMLEIADRIWSKIQNVNLPSNIGGNITKVRLFPRTDCCMDHIVGSVIQGSNDISNANGWTTLTTISEVPIAGWNEYPIRTTTAWRYLRFLAGPNGSGELKELEFYNGSIKLTGAIFGSAGYGVVFDGETSTSSFWQGTAPGAQNYAGVDLGAACSVLTASVFSPANNASVVGTASTVTPGRVITAISVSACAPAGTTISSVEVWAATSTGGFPNRMGYAVADASQPGVYKLSATEGSANGNWPTAFLDPGTYRFYAVITSGAGSCATSITTGYNTITLTAPAGTTCPTLAGSVLSPANNASIVGTASTVTAGRVITAISVSACAPSGSAITSVEVWAATSTGGFPNRMGYAVADASQPGVYKLSAIEGSASGQWPVAYLDPGTYRFYAVVNTSTTSFTTAYNTITLTAPAGTTCSTLTGSVLSPANNASIVGTASTVTAGRVITAISVSACAPTGSTITSVEVWAATSTGSFPNRMGYAVDDASEPGVYKLSATEGSANGQWPVAYLDPGTYRFYAVVNTSTTSFTTAYNTITLTAPTGTTCPTLTGSVLSPANNASVVGTASTVTAGRVITAISVSACAPSGSVITSVEVWAATSTGGFPNRMGYAVADASQPGVYKLSATEGSASGQWSVAYLDPGTYRFYAVVNTSTTSFTTAYNTITLTAPAGTTCPTLTGSVLSPANNASVVGTASTVTAGRVITAISVSACAPTGSSITSVEVWAATSDGGFPNRMGYAVADASQPGVYKLSAIEGSASGQWPVAYLDPGTYRFYAVVNTSTTSFTTAYNTITLTAAAGTTCSAFTASVISPINNATVVGTASTTTAGRVTTAISVSACVPAGTTISSVEIWAATSSGGFPNRMGYAVAVSGQPGVYTLSSAEGSDNGKWPIAYLDPGTYRFYAVVNTGGASLTTAYNTITLTTP